MSKSSSKKPAVKVLKSRKTNALHEKLLKLFLRPQGATSKTRVRREPTDRQSRRSIFSKSAATRPAW
jgi:hypothetical protein